MGCFNVSANLAHLFVGSPLLFKARIPLQQKLILLTIFGMGMLFSTAAVLCKIYGLYAPLISYSYLNCFPRKHPCRSISRISLSSTACSVKLSPHWQDGATGPTRDLPLGPMAMAASAPGPWILMTWKIYSRLRARSISSSTRIIILYPIP